MKVNVNVAYAEKQGLNKDFEFEDPKKLADFLDKNEKGHHVVAISLVGDIGKIRLGHTYGLSEDFYRSVFGHDPKDPFWSREGFKKMLWDMK